MKKPFGYRVIYNYPLNGRRLFPTSTQLWSDHIWEPLNDWGLGVTLTVKNKRTNKIGGNYKYIPSNTSYFY